MTAFILAVVTGAALLAATLAAIAYSERRHAARIGSARIRQIAYAASVQADLARLKAARADLARLASSLDAIA